jgi:hypothetical protein
VSGRERAKGRELKKGIDKLKEENERELKKGRYKLRKRV